MASKSRDCKRCGVDLDVHDGYCDGCHMFLDGEREGIAEAEVRYEQSHGSAYDAGVAEGEARATRAIVADLREHLLPQKGLHSLRDLANRYEAGAHLAAKAEGNRCK